MKYLVITLFFCIFANAQVEYDVYRFPSVTPEFVVRDDYIYSVDDFNVRSDQPIYKIEENRLYKVDSFGIVDYMNPIIIETWTKNQNGRQIFNTEKKLKMNDSENLLRIFSNRLGNSQMEKYLLRDF